MTQMVSKGIFNPLSAYSQQGQLAATHKQIGSGFGDVMSGLGGLGNLMTSVGGLAKTFRHN